jgi:hypothetical protein
MNDGDMESSVLFSLDELRQLERERQEDERRIFEARMAAERQAQLEAERLQREAEAERARIAEEERARDERLREAAQREAEVEQRNLEARLAIEEQLTLEQARIEAEARASMALRRASPWPRLLMLSAVLMSIVACGVWYYMRVGAAELSRERAQIEARERQAAARMGAREASDRAHLDAELDGLRAQLKERTATVNAPPTLNRPRPPSDEHHRHRVRPHEHETRSVTLPDSNDPLAMPD